MIETSGMKSFSGDLPAASEPVRHPFKLTLNSTPVLLWSAGLIAVSLGVTNRMVAWLARATLAGVIGYAYYEHNQLQAVQVEWFPIEDGRRGEYLRYLSIWKERIAQPVVEEEESEDDDLLSIPLGSVKDFVLGTKDPEQVEYERAWWKQVEVFEAGLLKTRDQNTHHYVVGLWKEGWLQSVMLLEYTDMQWTSLGTDGGQDNVVLLSLLTAPWNLRKRMGWAEEVFDKGIKGLFPEGIRVSCKPDECEPANYFVEKLQFKAIGGDGIYARTLKNPCAFD